MGWNLGAGDGRYVVHMALVTDIIWGVVWTGEMPDLQCVRVR